MASPFPESGSTRRPVRVVAGLMSGTSADAIDVAVCEFEGEGPLPRVRLIHHGERPLPAEVAAGVRGAGGLGVREVAELNVRVGEAFAAACLEVLGEAGVDRRDVAAIGSHGQTLYHHSGTPGAPRATLQVGDGDVIAERTGCLVVCDFRARDVAAGGEGAPLSPIADEVLFPPPAGGGPPRRLAVLNLGGIANVTLLGPGPGEVSGFDTGPANGPLDRLARRITGGALPCDRDGAIARAGRVDRALLDGLLADDPYLARRPPKSTGFEAYGDAFIEEAVRRRGGADADLMATLVEFVAESIARAMAGLLPPGPPVAELVAAGGGVRNPALFDRIRARLAPLPVVRSDERGIPSDAREAMAFAVLADRAIRGVPSAVGPVTGAAGPRVLGKIALP